VIESAGVLMPGRERNRNSRLDKQTTKDRCEMSIPSKVRGQSSEQRSSGDLGQDSPGKEGENEDQRKRREKKDLLALSPEGCGKEWGTVVKSLVTRKRSVRKSE